MVFSSITFLYVFFPIVLGIYYALPRKHKNFFLLIASLLFYAWGEPLYIVIMLFSTVFDYVNGILIEKYQKNPQTEHRAKYVVLGSIIINLGLLCFFKYTDFFIENLNQIPLFSNLKPLNLVLPIGISFYTFQTMSYTIDVYRKDVKAQRKLIPFGAYVTLFPQLIAGPIVRYKSIADQLEGRRETLERFYRGITKFTVGLGKKVLLANNIGMLFDYTKALPQTEISVVLSWLGVIAYGFQVYFDFSGYSDMAIGLSRMFGFEFEENFQYPYISKSITEFWRRWHISLGTWFREYVYIPLGGNRVTTGKHIRNILIVWLLTGFWHVAAWNFVLWGAYFGIVLLIEKYFLLNLLKKLPNIFSHFYALFFILIGWTIFAFDDFQMLKNYLQNMFFLNGLPLYNQQTAYAFSNYGVILIILAVASTPLLYRIYNRLKEKTWMPVVVGILVMSCLILSTAYLVDASYNPFLYFRF